MTTKTKEEPFVLHRNISGITETDVALSTGEGNYQVWEYTVPVGMSYIFSSEDTFSTYLENSSSAEVAAGSEVDIVIADASRQSIRTIMNSMRYGDCKEFQDRDKIVKLDIQPGMTVVAEEGERLLIRANANATIDASDSYFNLTCKRVRTTLFD